MKKIAVQIFSAAAVLVSIDQLIKNWVLANLKGQPAIVLIDSFLNFEAPFFRFVYVANSGAAFGMGSGFTAIISLIAIGVVIGLIRWSFQIDDFAWALAVALLLGGALGNLTDRFTQPPGLLRGHVIDFISVGGFPVFNFADICISAAAALMILLAVKRRPATKEITNE